MATTAKPKLDCIALNEWNKALVLNLPERDQKALLDMLELDTKIRQAARSMVP